MDILDIAILAAVFVTGQIAFDLNRHLARRAARGTGGQRTLWNLLAILAVVAGVSLFVYGIMNWTWWKVVLLWIGGGLVGSVIGKSLRRRNEEGLLKIESAAHVFMIAGAAFLWSRHLLS